MKITNTFIRIADDSPATQGTIPPLRDGAPSVARLQHDLLAQHPYEYDIDTLNFTVHCLRKGIRPEHQAVEREAFFAKGHPCMRASPLTKTYGYGAHYDGAGRIAIYPVDSKAYHKLVSDPTLTVEMAMRSKRPETSLQGSAQATGAHPGRGPHRLHSAA